MKAIKHLILFLVFTAISLNASAHNAVTYISEGAIIIGMVGFSVLLLGLIFGIIGLFKNNKFFKVITIIAACIGSLVALFLLSQSYNSFGNAFVPFLIYSVVMWSLISFRKADSYSFVTKPLFLGLTEGIAILVGGWFVTVISQGFFIDHQTWLFVVLYLSMFLIMLAGHRMFYQKRFTSNLTLEVKPGILASVYSGLIGISTFFIIETLRYMGSGFGLMSLGHSLRIFVMGVLPQLVFGISLSLFFSKTFTQLRENQNK